MEVLSFLNSAEQKSFVWSICENSIIEIKCPMSEKTVKNYVNNGKPTQKFYAQMQLQMLQTGHKKATSVLLTATTVPIRK